MQVASESASSEAPAPLKIIVFGGSGFVGSHVADALSDAGHAVAIFDREPSPHLRANQTFVTGDITDADKVAQAIDGHDIVYNFAGEPSIERSVVSPVDTVRTNVVGCANQLEAARHASVKRFIFASTVYVYSEAGAFYRVSKQSSELMVQEYQRWFGLDYTILRYGSLYGRRAGDSNAVRRYLRQALFEHKITAAGFPDQIREYIHVSDAARSSVEILSQEFRNQHVMLTGHQAIHLKDLLGMIREIVGDDVEVEIKEPEDGRLIGHYIATPYTFRPTVGKKLVSHYYSDLGQGLLDCLDEIHESQQGQANE